MDEIDPDRPYIRALSQSKAWTGVVKTGIDGGVPTTTDVYIRTVPLLRKPDGDPWYLPERGRPYKGPSAGRTPRGKSKRKGKKQVRAGTDHREHPHAPGGRSAKRAEREKTTWADSPELSSELMRLRERF